MSYDLGAPIREALIGNGQITALLGEWSGEPSIHTRRPVPSEAGYPLIVVGPDISAANQDYLRTHLPMPRRDVLIYGEQPDQYRQVEEIGYLVRDLFHRQRFSISVAGFHVIDIIASGPIVGPTDDTNHLCRAVPLLFRLQQLA